jgi:hypothetical protein
LAIWPFGTLRTGTFFNEGISLIAVFACMETVAPTLLNQFSDSRKIGVDCFSIGRFCPRAGGWATKRDDLRRVGGVEPNPWHRASLPKPRWWCRHVATGQSIMEFRKTGIPENRTGQWLVVPHTLHARAVMTAVWQSVVLAAPTHSTCGSIGVGGFFPLAVIPYKP